MTKDIVFERKCLIQFAIQTGLGVGETFRHRKEVIDSFTYSRIAVEVSLNELLNAIATTIRRRPND
ncbi:hypothetical protein M1D49_07875 [Bacillus sp. PK3-056]|uniref:hypothetical protein n=1 Tax=Niallia circulans TaxID=1397 RepID=UPI000F45A0E0|nr:hypothetical protein [Niallia circulans]AYV74276.1 hypothetical protein C2H98_23455 [Niallia circulans]